MENREIETFEQVRSLDRDALYGLLESERPEQRVWAVWAIALSLGERAGDFAHRVEQEPNPGVRRALAVILASHGEYDFLVELARHDPSLAVRESVIQLVTRLAAGSGHPQLRAVVEEGATGLPAIRIAILGGIGKGAPEYLVALAQKQLDSPEHEVQLEAFETLLRLDTRETWTRARLWFRCQPDLWNHTDRWLRASTLDALAETLADLPMHIRGRVLAKLREPPWPIVETLVGDDLELMRALLGRSDVAIPARVLARLVRTGAHEGFAARLAVQLATAARGRTLLVDLRAAIEADTDDAAPLPGLADRARRYADALELPDRHDVLAEIASAHPVEQLLGLENAVARWLAEHDAPAELLPLLPDLRGYCAQHLETLVRTNAGTQRRRRRLGELEIYGGAEPASEQQVFRDLLVALDQITKRG